MIEFYTRKMIEMHEKKDWIERNTYARAAEIDFVRHFYLKQD